MLKPDKGGRFLHAGRQRCNTSQQFVVSFFVNGIAFGRQRRAMVSEVVPFKPPDTPTMGDPGSNLAMGNALEQRSNVFDSRLRAVIPEFQHRLLHQILVFVLWKPVPTSNLENGPAKRNIETLKCAAV